MFRFHLARNLRSLMFLSVFAAIMAAIGVLVWANHTGMPASWRLAIEQAVSKQGAHIKIGSLRYVPLKGVIASDLRVYSEPLHIHEISRLERVILDFDKTRLARGEFHLNKIQLKDAQLILPVDPNDPKSETLNVSDVYGTIFMPGERRLEVRGGRGKIAGIDVVLDARIIGYQQAGKPPADDQNAGKRRELLARILKELGKWHFDKDQAPLLKIVVDGDANDRFSLTAKIGLDIKNMEKNGHRLQKINAEATLNGDLLTVTAFHAKDARGKLEAYMDYDIGAREGRFDITSTLDIQKLLTKWFDQPALPQVFVRGKQGIEAEGDFKLNEANKPELHSTGHVRCESVVMRGILFDSIDASFSWRDDSLFLRGVEVKRPDGAAEAKVMIEWPLVRLEAHSTLPVFAYRPFVVGLPLEIVLNDFTEREGAAVDVNIEGGFDVTNRFAWAYTGHGTSKNLTYKGVPLNYSECKFSLNHYELDFYDGTVIFNYSKYPLRKAFDGPFEGTVKVGRIRLNAPEKVVEVENVNGAVWAAPLVRLFAAPVADTLEQYRFHQPPNVKGFGVVDTTPQGRTDLHIAFSSEHPADYQFLGQNLTLNRPSAKVGIQGDHVSIRDMSAQTFGGPVAARFDYLGKGRFEGELNWTKLSVPDLTSTYGFQIKGSEGTTTGRIEFSITDGKVETMDGNGLVALEKAELFSVPMFGPLTPLIGGVLNNKSAGSQMAKNAFCTFTINNGVLSTQDFQTSTPSLNFAGEGQVDMNDQTIDMIVRMNARGLLGLLTLPLRPFSGLFQFHGTGPLKDPKWENMKFTSPPEAQNDLLLAPPRARVIAVPE